MSTFKILVGGHFNAGKTTFVKNASDNSLLSTEKQTTSEEERKVKASTTVAMDFASAKEGKVELKIFGIPGQERFSFMWNVLARGTQGFVFLIDSTREDMWCETVKQMKVMLKDKNVPYIICANKQDLPEAKDLQYIRQKMKEMFGEEEIYPCVAKDREIVKQLLSILVHKLLKESEKAEIV